MSKPIKRTPAMQGSVGQKLSHAHREKLTRLIDEHSLIAASRSLRSSPATIGKLADGIPCRVDVVENISLQLERIK